MVNKIRMSFIVTVWEGIDWLYLAYEKGQVLCFSEHVNKLSGFTGLVELLIYMRNSQLITDVDLRIYLFC
jgi:hypothetical protein